MTNQLKVEELKGRFYDLLLNEKLASKDKIVNVFLQEILHFFSADAVNYYVFDQIGNQFVLASSVDKPTFNTEQIFQLNNSLSFYSELVEGKVYIEKNSTSQLVYIPFMNSSRVLSIQFTILQSLNVNWVELSTISTNFLLKVSKLVELTDGERRSRLLYKVTSKFHSSMNTDDVLGEIISTLKEEYPTFTYYLLLSHDNTNSKQLPIKEIQYDDSNMPASQAFVTGEIQVMDSLEGGNSSLYAPLKGKQGIYGVLQVIAPNSLIFPNEEVQFISLLAQTAGSALENARLYQQSRQLITDLQLINETSHQLNANLRLNEAMTFMSNQIIKSFHATEVGFCLFDKDDTPSLLPGSTDYFKTDSGAGYFIKFLFDRISLDKEALFIGDLKIDPQVPYRSVMAVPMIQEERLRGVAIILHSEPYFFAFESFKLLQSLIYHSTLALTNSMLREELENLVITDFLTKLYSRKYLNESIEKSMELDGFGTFLLIDIDNFKLVNDSYGHQVGDEILKQVAQIIKDNIREFDIGARWGGEELAIYLPRVELHAGIAVANRLVHKVEELTHPPITISCGVSYWKKGQPDTPVTLFKRADEALYYAKKSGKNQIQIHSH